MPKPWGQPSKLATGVLNAQGRINSNDLGQTGSGAAGFGTAALGGSIDGDEITIETDGTYDFGSKTNALPMFHIDPGMTGTLSETQWSRKPITFIDRELGTLDTETAYLSGGAARARLLPSDPDSGSYRVPSGSIGPPLGEMTLDEDGGADHIIILCRKRRDFNGTDAQQKNDELEPGVDWNIKSWRWYESGGGTPNFVIPGWGQTSSSHGNPRLSWEGNLSGSGDGSEFYASQLSEPDWVGMGKNQWLSEALWVRQSSAPGQRDGRLVALYQGERYEFGPFTTQDDNGTDKLRNLVMEQPQFLHTDNEFNVWYDYVYVDDTPQCVIISEAANWGDVNVQFDPAIPLTWSSSKITAKMRTSAITGKYLYVINDTGDPVITTGVLIGEDEND